MAEETTTIVIMGVTGDLARRKLLRYCSSLGARGRWPKPQTYQPGSWGPEGADALLSQDGRAWQRGCGLYGGTDG